MMAIEWGRHNPGGCPEPSVEETAEVLKVSTDTVLRDWKPAMAWLRRELKKDKPYDA